MTVNIGRRDLLAAFGGAAVAWPLAARAQQPAMPVRRVGVLLASSETDSEGQARIGALRQGLQELGWSEGRNLKIDYRWTGGDDVRARAYAAELVASQPDAIFAAPSSALASVQRATRTIPIVFAQISDPVGAGFVASLAHPGGNITGFALFEFAIGAKWLELLKQIAPSVMRVAAIYDPATPSAYGFLPMIEAAGRSFGVDVIIHAVHDTTEIERVIIKSTKKTLQLIMRDLHISPYSQMVKLYGDARMIDQPPSAMTPTLVGSWRKITTSACANKYPEKISFAVGTYSGTRGPGQPFVWWDAGIYRVEDETTLVLGTATDELVAYKIQLSTDRLDVTDADGCRFSYQREKPVR